MCGVGRACALRSVAPQYRWSRATKVTCTRSHSPVPAHTMARETAHTRQAIARGAAGRLAHRSHARMCLPRRHTAHAILAAPGLAKEGPSGGPAMYTCASQRSARRPAEHRLQVPRAHSPRRCGSHATVTHTHILDKHAPYTCARTQNIYTHASYVHTSLSCIGCTQSPCLPSTTALLHACAPQRPGSRPPCATRAAPLRRLTGTCTRCRRTCPSTWWGWWRTARSASRAGPCVCMAGARVHEQRPWWRRACHGAGCSSWGGASFATVGTQVHAHACIYMCACVLRASRALSAAPLLATCGRRGWRGACGRFMRLHARGTSACWPGALPLCVVLPT